ncbi:unnamed protein product [Closterium sp. NIES-65]|nr:unnamed protein product [Closterium sp. NIES-65]
MARRQLRQGWGKIGGREMVGMGRQGKRGRGGWRRAAAAVTGGVRGKAGEGACGCARTHNMWIWWGWGGGAGGIGGSSGGGGGVQWAEWAGRVHELAGVFVSGEGRVFNSTHVFHANGCHGLTQFFYPFGTRVTIHDTLVNLLVPRGHVAAADVAGSRDRSGATVLQLAPLLLQVAPFLRENPELPLLLGQARCSAVLCCASVRDTFAAGRFMGMWSALLLPRLLASASLNATIVVPPAADELFFVRRLIQVIPQVTQVIPVVTEVILYMTQAPEALSVVPSPLFPPQFFCPFSSSLSLSPPQPIQQHCVHLSPSVSFHLPSHFLLSASSHVLPPVHLPASLASPSTSPPSSTAPTQQHCGRLSPSVWTHLRSSFLLHPSSNHLPLLQPDWSLRPAVGGTYQDKRSHPDSSEKEDDSSGIGEESGGRDRVEGEGEEGQEGSVKGVREEGKVVVVAMPRGVQMAEFDWLVGLLRQQFGESNVTVPLLSNPLPDPFLSSSSIIQSLSATCHLHVVSVPSERLNFKPLPKLWLVTEPEAREDGEMDLGDSQGGGSAVGAEGGSLGKDAVGDADEKRENGDENSDDADWGEEAEEEREGETKSMQVEGKREEAEEERGEKEEDVGGIRITWSREDLGEAVSEACLHLGLDCLRLGSRGAAEERVSEAERKKRERLEKRLRRREAEAWKVPGSWLRRRRDVRVFERWLEQADEGVGVSGIKADEIVRRGGSEEEWTVRESLKYEWRTPPGKCPLGGLKTFDGAAFCKRAREERGTINIVFLGDSLTFQMAGSFLNGLLRHIAKPASWAVDEFEPKQCVDWLLGRGGAESGGGGVSEDGSRKPRRAARWRNLRSRDGSTSAITGAANIGDEEVAEGEEEGEEEEGEEGDRGSAPVVVTPHPFCKVYVFHENVCPGVKIHVIRNDHLYIQDPDLASPADGSSTTSSSNGSATGGSVPFDHMPWHLYDGLVSADVVVVNRGAHYVGGRDFELSVRAAMRLLRRKLPRALLVYRNSPPGHVNCSSYDRPIKIRQDPATLPFHWDTFSSQNDIAREIAEEVKAVYMDVDTMTALRPDGHKGGLVTGEEGAGSEGDEGGEGGAGGEGGDGGAGSGGGEGGAGPSPAVLDHPLQCWTIPCSAGPSPAVLDHPLQCWTIPCSAGPSPAVLDHPLQCWT